MSNYIGNQPSAGEFKKLDSIASSFNGSLTQFDLDYSTVNQSVGDATQLIVSLNGIIQEPGTAYTLGIGGGSIVFASAPASTDTCHIVLLGGVGGTTTPTDGSVTASKLDSSLKDYLEETFTANGSQTTYTLTRAAIGSNSLLLSVDGILQPSTAYSVAGTTLTISPALPNTTNVRVVHLGVQSGVYIPAADSITSNQLATLNGNLNFDDNSKAVFGEGSDLQIYHDGSHSYVDDQGTGQLRLRGTTQIQFLSGTNDYMATMVNDGAVNLYYDNANKLATTSTGVDVTGTVTSDGLGVSGLVTLDDYSGNSGRGRISIGNSGQQYIEGYDTGNAGSGSYLSFGQGAAERMRIDSSGNLLVGKTSTGSSIRGSELRDGTSGFVATFKSDADGINIDRSSDGELINFRVGGAANGNISGVGTNLHIGKTSGLSFQNNDVIRPVKNNVRTTDVIDLGDAGGRFKDLYLSGGVVFDAVSGNATSNTLDDYEEGSWLPSLGAASANPTVGYNAQVGHYTKIGNLVTVSCRMITNSRSGGSGHLLVRGLPFTVAIGEAYASATIGFNYNWNTPPQHAGAQGNTVTVLLYQDGRTNAVSGSGDIAASGSSYLNLSCSYITNA